MTYVRFSSMRRAGVSALVVLFAVACSKVPITAQTPTASLSANPGTIVTGNTSVLTWSSTNASSCSATGAWSGTLATSGSQTVTQWTNQTYGITCTGTGGSASQSATVVSPQIEISSNAENVKGFSIGGLPFVPIGVNYMIEGHSTYNGQSYQTFDMFDTQNFNASNIDAQMAAISANGFNYVRLWLKGVDTDNGFSQPNAWSLYVSNIVTTIHSAEKYGLHVVLTGSFPGPLGTWFVPANYAPPASDIPSTVTSMNVLLLVPDVSKGLEQFYSALLTAMQALDPNISTAIFYFDLYNELQADTTGLPLSLTSGTFSFEGTTYNMNDFNADPSDTTSRQAMLDAAAQHVISEMGYGVKSVMPHVLFTASSGLNYAFNHTAFDGGQTMSTKAYFMRPFYVLAGGASIIDIHLYPSPTFMAHDVPGMLSDELVNTTTTRVGPQINARVAPFIAGEFGTNTTSYVTTGTTYAQGMENGISEMDSVESGMYCPYGYTGFAVWNWNIDNAGSFTLVDPTNDPTLVFMQALAPKYVPQFCSQTVTP